MSRKDEGFFGKDDFSGFYRKAPLWRKVLCAPFYAVGVVVLAIGVVLAGIGDFILYGR